MEFINKRIPSQRKKKIYKNKTVAPAPIVTTVSSDIVTEKKKTPKKVVSKTVAVSTEENK